MLVFGFVAAPPLAASAAVSVKVLVNGHEISFPDAQPFIDSNGRTQVPVRFVAEAMNAKVDWDNKAKRVEIERGAVKISMAIDIKELVVLGVKKEMDTAPVLLGSRTFVPLRYISEGLGASVEWEGATRTVRITDSGKNSYMIGHFSVAIETGEFVDTSADGALIVAKKSGLIIGEAASSTQGNSSNLVIYIKVDSENMDIPKQRKEAEELLRQKLSGGAVDEVMQYASAKKGRMDELETKIIWDGDYQIIISGSIGPIRIAVYFRG